MTTGRETKCIGFPKPCRTMCAQVTINISIKMGRMLGSKNTTYHSVQAMWRNERMKMQKRIKKSDDRGHRGLNKESTTNVHTY